jgi:hypothetical protein
MTQCRIVDRHGTGTLAGDLRFNKSTPHRLSTAGATSVRRYLRASSENGETFTQRIGTSFMSVRTAIAG